MSGFMVCVRDAEELPGDLERGSAAFLRKGLLPREAIDRPNYHLRLFANPSHDPHVAMSMDDEQRFCTYVGTLMYRGMSGKRATEALLRSFMQEGVHCLKEAIGNYVLLVDDGDGLAIAGDPAGLHHYYESPDGRVISNSFLAVATTQEQHAFRTQEVLEYILLGAMFGENTLLEGVKRVDCVQWLRVRSGRVHHAARDTGWTSGDVAQAPVDARAKVTEALEIADRYYGQIASAFPGRVTAALSGGYDSRLNLALLLRHGIVPSLFVYGAPGDTDVQIAKQICQGEGLSLSHQDRGNRPSMEPEQYWENQEAVFHGLDGLTQYGFACEPHEVSHRWARVDGGLVAVNGGGGEIWRDFWKLPDRPMWAREFAFSYFLGRFSGLRASAISERSFLEALAAKIEDIVGAENRSLTSSEVQSLYPRLRLQYWQGKNNSVDNHIGFAVTPFAETCFTQPSIHIPMSAKRDGWFERQMLLQISPSLASYRSSHGYDLKTGPNAFERGKAFVTRHLPAGLRTRRRRMSLRRNRFYFQADKYIQARFGTGDFEVERYVNLSELGDPLAFSRALTVERMMRGEWLGHGPRKFPNCP
jgi:asparagine synthase (glutamine-hydrolysing)